MLTDTVFRSVSAIPALQGQLKRLLLRLPSRRRVIEHRGQRLIVDPTELSGYYLYYEQAYDREVFDFLETVVSDYSRVLDVGANIGVYTVFFAARVPLVDAFEPVREVVPRLTENIALNGFSNVALHEVCVSGDDGIVQLICPPCANLGIGHIAPKVGGFPCPSVCLDSFFGGYITEPTLIKMDIEGAEWMALTGARSILRNRKAPLTILLEVHPQEIENYGGNVLAIYQSLLEAGLRVRTITRPGLIDFSPKDPPRFWWASGQ
jgi:FkbM family methyltransferase